MTSRRTTLIAALSAVAAGLLLVVVNERDQDQEPPTDAADFLATAIVLIGTATWLATRRLETTSRVFDGCRAVAACAAVGAALVGLVSVVYDPWAN
ncbi:MAG: hypothetical protein ACR2PK_14180 [Acidimicrobiales bacterium]